MLKYFTNLFRYLGAYKKATIITPIITALEVVLEVLIPFIMMIGAYLLYKKHYILDEDEYDRIVRELAERNAE